MIKKLIKMIAVSTAFMVFTPLSWGMEPLPEALNPTGRSAFPERTRPTDEFILPEVTKPTSLPAATTAEIKTSSLQAKNILVTGGTGYIGSHTVVELLQKGSNVIILDSLTNSKGIVCTKIKEITQKVPTLVKGDIGDRAKLQEILKYNAIDAVIHFAGLKAVGEGEVDPLSYYGTNVAGSIILLQEMAKANVKTMVFSSSCTVYKPHDNGEPYCEECDLEPISVYGRTKLMAETVFRDIKKAHPEWKIGILRYFNPVGAHPSGIIGEDPKGIPNNLMPIVAQVAVGKRQKLSVFGDDYPTHDGTGVRDYIHVVDLAKAHIDVLDALFSGPQTMLTLNLGTGNGYSVFDVVKSFQTASGKSIPYEIVDRRPGDVSQVYANAHRAKEQLGWEAHHDIDKMCRDAWNFQQKNPNGYL